MLKQRVIVGIPMVITTVRALANIEAPGHGDTSLSPCDASLTGRPQGNQDKVRLTKFQRS
jgi:hypothetical protein